MLFLLIVFVLAIVGLVLGIKGVKKQKASKAEIADSVQRAREFAASTNEIEFVVAGIPHHLDAVMSLAEEDDDFKLPKKRIIEEFSGKVFRWYFSPLPCSIVPEPENEFDPNALKVYASSEFVGYIREADTAKVRAVMSGRFGKVERCRIEFEGGEYKSPELDDEGTWYLEEGEDPIYGTVTFTVRPDDQRDVAPVTLTAKDLTL